MKHSILYLVGQLRAGGLERQLYYLLQTLDRDRYKPAVAVWNYREQDAYVRQIRALGVPLYAMPAQESRAIKLKALGRLVRQLQPAVLHSYTFYTNFGAWLVTRGTKTIAIGSVRSDFRRAKKESGWWLGKLSARWPRCQIFNSCAAAEIAKSSHSLFVPGQLFMIRNGLDLQRFQMVPLRTTGPAHIIGIGSLLPIKRWDRLLKASSALRHKGFEFSVQIAGDGPLHASLVQHIQAWDIADCVEFVGHRDDIPRLLNDATFLVHTSDSEGCPNVIIEAMACGRAVVATAAGDVPSIVDEGITGFAVQCSDDPMLMTRMATLIANRALCGRMGEAARAKAEQAFGLDRLVAETLAVYSAAGWKG